MLDDLSEGIGSTIDNTVTGATDTAGEAAGNLLGGVFGPFGNFVLKLALIVVGGFVAIRVIG